MLEVMNLTCTRGERTLFQDVSFTLAPRGLVHIAGANGSGKTSLMRIICGLSVPDAGEVRWHGTSIRVQRETYSHQMVYLGHAHALKDDLSPAENLALACALAGRPATHEAIGAALTQFGLAACAQLPVRALSQGQKRRSALARLALSREARLWILDEPFAALDVHAVRHLETLIVSYIDGGGSVMFTTHQDGTLAARVSQRVDLDVAGDAAGDDMGAAAC
jgi:heme exporter protein A